MVGGSVQQIVGPITSVAGMSMVVRLVDSVVGGMTFYQLRKPTMRFVYAKIRDPVGFIPAGYPIPPFFVVGEDVYEYGDLISGALDKMQERLGPEHPLMVKAEDVTGQVMGLALYMEADVIVAWSPKAIEGMVLGPEDEILGYSICCVLMPGVVGDKHFYGEVKSFYLGALVNTSGAKGVGVGIIGEAARIARLKGLDRVSVASDKDLVRYYEKLGFIHSNPNDWRDMVLLV